jgi:hypothetical protein
MTNSNCMSITNSDYSGTNQPVLRIMKSQVNPMDNGVGKTLIINIWAEDKLLTIRLSHNISTELCGGNTGLL